MAIVHDGPQSVNLLYPDPLGIDEKTGIVHYDSHTAYSFIWPLCGTSGLGLKRVASSRVVTCVECLAYYVKYWCGQGNNGEA